MSHTTAIRAIQITSIKALRNAVNELAAAGKKISMQDGGKPRAYSPNQPGMGVADHVIKLPNAAYDIGVYNDGKGGFELRTDFWGGSVERELGVTATTAENRDQARLGSLYQMYAVNAAEEEAYNKGLIVERNSAKDGTIQLVLTGAFD